MAENWESLTPPYSTIVVDPPWSYAQDRGWPSFKAGSHGGDRPGRRPVPYSFMETKEITELPVGELAASDSHLYLWTTNRYVRDAYGVVEAWGFRPVQLLTWCKAPMGILPSGVFTSTTEFILFARRGKLSANGRVDSTWWQWKRSSAVHSEKPTAFLDVVEQVSPRPYVELFCRQPRLGWDSWGWGYEQAVGA